MSKRIWVVDDDCEIQEIVSFVLLQYGFEVRVASHGAQLQELLMEQLPDAIILDVMMPGEDGYQICRSLRQDERTCNIPIMIMTAHAEDIYERISRDLGVSVHLTKPFHPLELAERVVDLVRMA